LGVPVTIIYLGARPVFKRGQWPSAAALLCLNKHWKDRVIPLKVFILLPWIGAAALMAKFTSSWNELPERVATHFGLSGEPNGWMNKRPLVAIMIVVTLAICGGTIPLMTIEPRKSAGALCTVLLTSTAVIGAFWEMINYNVTGQKFRMLRPLLPVAGMGALLLLNYFAKPV